MEKTVEKPPSFSKPKSKRLSIRRVKGRRYASRDRDDDMPDTAIPRDVHRKLWGLFAEIEREFEKVYIENADRKKLYCCRLCNLLAREVSTKHFYTLTNSKQGTREDWGQLLTWGNCSRLTHHSRNVQKFNCCKK